MSLRLRTLLAAGMLATGLSAPAADSPVTVEGDLLQLPDMKVSAGQDFVFPEKKAVTAPDFPPNAPLIDVQYPGRAFHEGVATGRATVGVMLDQAGRPVDFLLIRYTRDYFGQALLAEAKRRDYRPKRLDGVAVPGPFTFSYHFEPPQGLTHISSFEAASRRVEEVQGGAGYVYAPRREAELDGGRLEPVQVAIPVLPAHLVRPDKPPVRVLVSFYVDEQGRVRLPNVESSLAPELVAGAVQALQQWAFKPPTFKPPTVKAKPVLVRAVRAVTFRAAPAAAPDQ
jgi:hypothetical protein